MKTILVASLMIFGAFCAASFLPPTEAGIAQARAYFTEDEIERGWQHSFEHRILAWIRTAVHLGWLLVLVYTPLGRRLADRCLQLTRGWWLPAVALMGLAYFLVDKLLGLPFGILRWALEEQWGMTALAFRGWLADLRLSLLVDLATSSIVMVGLYVLLRFFPRRWWLGAWLAGTVLAVGYAFMLPVLIEPIFNTFTPLRDTKWAALETPVRALVAKAGVEVGDLFVVDASRRSHHTNAYFTGFGATRRIVLYDNLLVRHTGPEVETIIAHELGHWLHNHIVKGIALASAGMLAGLYLLSRFLLWAQGRGSLALRSLSDPAGLPLLVLVVWMGSWLALPLENAVSRHFERQADAVSLELAQMPTVFIDAEKRLARDNLSNVIPHPLAVWLYYTHPTAVETIRMAEEWRR